MNPTLRRALPVALILVALCLAAASGGYFTADNSAPPGSVPDLLPTPEAPLRGVIVSVTGNELTVETGGSRETYELPAGVVIEAMQPAQPQSISVGEWLNGRAITSSQTFFTLTGLTLIPAELRAGP